MEKEILTVFLVKAEFQGFSSKSTSIHCLGAYGWGLWANKSLLTLQKADQKPVVWAHIADVGPCSTVGHKCWVLWRHLCALWPSASPMKPSRVKVSWDPDGHTAGAWPDGHGGHPFPSLPSPQKYSLLKAERTADRGSEREWADFLLPTSEV